MLQHMTSIPFLTRLHNPGFLQDGPSAMSEFLQDGLGGLSRLNVSMPQLPPLPQLPNLPALSLQLQLPSLESLIASAALRGAGAGFNLSSLLGLTDSLTDTLTDTFNDLTDSLSGSLSLNLSLSVSSQLRSLLSQLPAFSLPALPGAGANASSEGAGVRPGLVMARRGYKAKHPVVIVPGFVTSGLELWRGLPCGQRYFRQRMWGTLAMVQAFLTDPGCWFKHMELDPVTGLDPDGIKIRAAVGLEAVDFFIQGYWVWGKLVEALADVGYDSNSLVSMPYDWRLAMPLLEERDGYFTRLRGAVESLVEVSGERVVITVHSYGENVVRGFMHWVESDRPGWVESHVAALVNIAGTALGVPKSVSALLSGETRDTAQLGALAGFLTSNLVPRATRTRVWRTWGASYAMLPVGGPRVWGNASWAPDDSPEMRAAKRTYGAMVSLWPHNWQSVLAAAAAAAPPPEREQLHQLVAGVSQAADEQTEPAPPAGEAAAAAVGGAGAAVEAAPVPAVKPAGASAGGRDAGDSLPPPSPECAAGGGGSDAGESCSSGIGIGDSSVGTSPAPNATADASSSGDGSGGSGSGAAKGGGSSSGGGVSGPMSLLADKLKRLVGAGGAEVDPAEHLRSDHVDRLDVTGFLSLLREVGGPLVARHMAEWGAVAPDADAADGAAPDEGQAGESEAAGMAARRAQAAADAAGPKSDQALGGPARLRRTASAEAAAGAARGRQGRRRAALFPDATRVPLPNAPSTTIVCLYGVGLPTERAYHYLRPPPPPAAPPAASAAALGAAAPAAAPASTGGEDPAAAANGEATGGEGAGGAGGASGERSSSEGEGEGEGQAPPPPHSAAASGEEANVESGGDAASGWMIMRDVSQPGHALDVGVQLGDGDGTVPLISLGLMCRGGWRPGGRLNPAGMRVVTREFKHRSVSMMKDARGGPETAAHVDILGNEGVLADVIRVAAGRADELSDVIVSDIDRIAAAAQLDL
ncbi:hypothetical protein GPECTOR_42g827 [Gonium pectorale]|uniref:Phospholipid:diacylglycerol acyltransferase n=1 Tax=Gonium pectorale TaxID=33097 RepID=A0A150G9T9_GONPE|nr:hypothetical protein GPECTOR_42g827 [Gonium pectorale]|eukprot:KXZ46616.1 hypothetical protein GPECTOR_42g827 [Gonium pectorale]